MVRVTSYETALPSLLMDSSSDDKSSAAPPGPRSVIKNSPARSASWAALRNNLHARAEGRRPDGARAATEYDVQRRRPEGDNFSAAAQVAPRQQTPPACDPRDVRTPRRRDDGNVMATRRQQQASCTGVVSSDKDPPTSHKRRKPHQQRPSPCRTVTRHENAS